jgi:fructosamine-3-kinase
MNPPHPAIAEHVSRATGKSFAPKRERSIGGGCINTAVALEDGAQKYFVKLNDASKLSMFEAEAAGLAEMAAAHAVRVPQPVCVGASGGSAYLVLEYLDLSGLDTPALETLGRQLALLHRKTQAAFGWHRDNTIGATAQTNTPNESWVQFYGERRLRFQLQLAAQNGLRGSIQQKGERLIDGLPAFFTDYRPLPSLLHGDLWGGNAAATSTGEPVVFDPAVYYGDREADLAMTELFGGFGARFYAAYREAWAPDVGFGVRKALYHLYHVLNHYNLFGGGYASQAERTIDSLLVEIG